MDTAEYPRRTEQNVIDSDATLILYEQRLSGGTLLTRRFANRWMKPVLCLKLESSEPVEIRDWLARQRPVILNIAGPRETSFPGIQDRSLEFLLEAFAIQTTGDGPDSA